MKRIAALILLLLLLTGCHAPTEDVPEPLPEQTTRTETQTPGTEVPASTNAEKPQEEIPVSVVIRNPMEEEACPREMDEPFPKPEEEAAYICETDHVATAVSPAGEVILQLPNVSLSLLKDQISKEPVGLLAKTKGDYNRDGWGNLYDERATSTLYDLDGRFLMNLPSQSVSVYGNLLWCGLLVDEQPRIYRFPSGQLLYTDVASFGTVGDHVLFTANETDWVTSTDHQILLQAPAGTISRMPSKPYVIVEEDGTKTMYDLTGAPVFTWTDGEVTDVLEREPPALIWKREGRYSVVDTTGTPLLPETYEEIQVLGNGLLQVHGAQGHQLIDPDTGEILFQHTRRFTCLSRDYLVCISEENAADHLLVDRAGTVLAGTGMGWDFIEVEGWDEQGNLVLFSGMDWDAGDEHPTTTCFRPDGTAVWQMEEGYRPLTAHTLCSGSVTKDGMFNTAMLIDRQTGALLFRAEMPGLRMEPICDQELSGQILEGRYVTLSATEDSGETVWSVIHESGNMVLEGCRDLIYRGGGVVQCTKDGIRGLLRLDGTWLYQATE